ncbi:MAG: SDR family oxidoreductase [Ignavibacteriales bacterium]|nr:SDR family oxidoreductase [Ignavibacteriales bacterium]
MADRSVLITGGSSGIGSALAAVFVRHGDRVVVVARRKALLGRLETELRTQGGICHAISCDVRDERSVKAAVIHGQRHTGPFDVLINNAGVTIFKTAPKTSLKEFDEVLDTNLRGQVTVTMKVLPSMLKRGRGLIINVLSYAAKTTYVASSAYSAAKAGAEAYMNVLREEVRGKNVKVMNVYPGAVLTEMWQPSQRRQFARRMMNPTHVAELVYAASMQPASMMVEELVLRPQQGDLKL